MRYTRDVPPPTLTERRIPTPLGDMLAAVAHGADVHALCMLAFADSRRIDNERRELAEALGAAHHEDLPESPDPVLEQTERELAEYFDGARTTFTIPLHTPGTPFRQRVWNALRAIPHAETRSYRDIAAALGSPGAVRAVGAANGANRIAIVIPCHRVIASSGALHGYGGGLERKRWLLEHEAGDGATLFAEAGTRRLV